MGSRKGSGSSANGSGGGGTGTNGESTGHSSELNAFEELRIFIKQVSLIRQIKYTWDFQRLQRGNIITLNYYERLIDLEFTLNEYYRKIESISEKMKVKKYIIDIKYKLLFRNNIYIEIDNNDKLNIDKINIIDNNYKHFMFWFCE